MRLFPRFSLCAAALLVLAAAMRAPVIRTLPAGPCVPDNGGLRLPDGFCASVFASDIGAVRHIAIAPDGALYAAASAGFLRGGVTVLRDRDGDGTPDERASFGPRGVNDVAVHAGYLYLALEDRVLRYRLTAGRLEPEGDAETMVSHLPAEGDHDQKTLAFPGEDVMLVKIGSASNSCQEANRRERSPGRDPCVELQRHAGLWRFAAGRPGQRFADGRRWATGMRNAEAITVQPGTNAVWAAVHGRDQLGGNWGYTPEDNAENPAEELVQVSEGDDIGWPYCYHSNEARKKVLAPEYGGDGRTVGRCAKAKNAAVAFPGHWAPMSLAFYPGARFGADYAGGLFVTFHGSWNRAPLPQAGYRVVFVPFMDGKPSGEYRTFATLEGAPFRAVGLAVGKDGALFVSADDNRTIWRIVKR
ncbi:MAG TPA: PQQ-dependent sugar dehydrogenase [Gemmatimonadales bacterium]|nr:PQQ-dependent sugar dehydrogenase [Gemmatimonadales bacterium]